MDKYNLPTEWRILPLQDVCTHFVSGGTPSTKVKHYWRGNIPWITSADIGDLKVAGIRKYVSEEGVRNSATSVIKKGDLLIVTRVGVGKLAIAPFDIAISQDTTGVTPNRKIVDATYLMLAIYHSIPRLVLYNQGTSINGVTRKDLRKLTIPVPTLPEQYKIAEILSTWGKAIELVGKQIKAKQRLKKGLMQQLIPGKLKGDLAIDALPDGWQRYKIGQVLIRERQPVQVEESKVYREIGIRSHTKGIFYKEQTTGAKLGNKSVFWVIPDCFILNIVFAWEQAVAKTTRAEDGMIASHRFPMYKPKDDVLDLDYLLYFFQTPYGKHLLGLASPGGAGRNKTLGQDTFLKLSITLPSIDEQRKIGSLLRLCDKELGILSKSKDALRRQKEGLMQKLLTGEVRVMV